MKRGLEWYKHYPVSFLDGVQGMGPEFIGAYAVILDLLYARGGDTRRDDRHLAGILGCSTRKARILTDHLIEIGKIDTFQAVDNPVDKSVDNSWFLTNRRVKNEVESARKFRETSVKHGRMGGEKSARSRKFKHIAEAIPQPYREDKDKPLTPFKKKQERPPAEERRKLADDIMKEKGFR